MHTLLLQRVTVSETKISTKLLVVELTILVDVRKFFRFRLVDFCAGVEHK